MLATSPLQEILFITFKYVYTCINVMQRNAIFYSRNPDSSLNVAQAAGIPAVRHHHIQGCFEDVVTDEELKQEELNRI